MLKPKILAIIPARGGSKGIPQKNIRLLNGRPLISYTIEATLNSATIDKLVVSTEDEGIASIAREWGAEIVSRPRELAGDIVLTEPVMNHALEDVEQHGFRPDFVSLVQATSPFLDSTVIRKAVHKVVEDEFDSCISVFLPHGHEFKWRRSKTDQELFEPDHDIQNRPRRQGLSQRYHENGAFYITRTDLFKKTQSRFGGNLARITAVEMREEDSLQIDNEFDFWLAERLMKQRRGWGTPNFEKLKILFLDFDGVLTNNKVLVSSHNDGESVFCDRSDSLGIELLKRKGLKVFVISKERSQVVKFRCQKLGLPYTDGVDDKWRQVQKILQEEGVSSEDSCFIGNDIIDLECIKRIGIGVAPSDAIGKVKENADYVTRSKGGNGCVREVADLILTDLYT